MRSSLRSPCLLVAMLLAGASACDGPAHTSGSAASSTSTAVSAASAAAVGADVLVTVNGVPIRVPDLHYVLASKAKGRAGGVDAAKSKEALDMIIGQELVRQQAEAQGLDADPEYLRKRRFMEAPLNDLARTELGKLFFSKELADKAKISEAEARKHFEDNSARFKTEVWLYQIMVRGDDDKIVALRKELDAGGDFETVAAKLFPPNLPKTGKKPWDLGFLRWNRVQPQFAKAVAQMKEGDVSHILRGPKKRTWIIKLVKRRVNEAITFEQVKPDLIDMLRKTKRIELARKTAQQLRDKAKIVYLREPGAMPAPPDPD